MKACRCKHFQQRCRSYRKGCCKDNCEEPGVAQSPLRWDAGLIRWKGWEMWVTEGGGKPPRCVAGCWMPPSTPRMG